MWKDDNDRIEIVIDGIMAKTMGDAPLVCSVCKESQVHYYIHKWNENSTKGGIWVWCSECRCFSHGIVNVPNWWENCKEILIENLNSLPDYLEDSRVKVDTYVNQLYKKK